ncbi:MAG: aminotransferase class V-fold PLP-dependent enzyme [Geminocystis sp.]|nr:aminotransferase class V-fold PLP-dependent enzyme [Geminocystis sp.]HIK36946.1 aminotransferase class V-fold PLP-dependent enzyme [Geminocystis sp. M7585_C2015_104]
MLDLTSYRQQFPGLQNKFYFNYGGQGVLPQAALASITSAYNYIAEIGPFSIKGNKWVEETIYETKKVIASELGVSVDSVALTENVTEGCNIVLWGIDWQEGDEILLTDAEHPGIVAIVKEIGRRFRVKVTTIPLLKALFHQDNPLETISAYLTPQTRLLVISHILWNTGHLLPLRDIVNLCHQYPHSRKPIYVLADGAQSAGSIPLSLAEEGVDFYAGTGHKWLCGPSGVGFLYIRQELIPFIAPTFIGWRGLDFSNSHLSFLESASRYEVATSPYPLFLGLKTAIQLHQSWGTVEQRYERILQLSHLLWTKLQQINGIRCLHPSTPPLSGLVSFYLPAGNPKQIVQILESNGFLLRTLSYPPCIRACVHYFTLESEIYSLLNFLSSLLSKGIGANI